MIKRILEWAYNSLAFFMISVVLITALILPWLFKFFTWYAAWVNS